MPLWTAALAAAALAVGCGESRDATSKRTGAGPQAEKDAATTAAGGNKPAGDAQGVSFDLTVAPLLRRGCGSGGCHGAGSSFGVWTDQEAAFVAAGSEVIARLASTDKSLMMPQYGFPVEWSAADSKVLASFLQQKGVKAADKLVASTTAEMATGPGNAGAARPSSPSLPAEKLCAGVTAEQKAAGLAMTFTEVTTVFTANCAAAGCHVGAAPHGFVGRPESLQNRSYAAGIVIDLKSGTMPKGKSISAADKAAAISYICARYDF